VEQSLSREFHGLLAHLKKMKILVTLSAGAGVPGKPGLGLLGWRRRGPRTGPVLPGLVVEALAPAFGQGFELLLEPSLEEPADMRRRAGIYSRLCF